MVVGEETMSSAGRVLLRDAALASLAGALVVVMLLSCDGGEPRDESAAVEWTNPEPWPMVMMTQDSLNIIKRTAEDRQLTFSGPASDEETLREFMAYASRDPSLLEDVRVSAARESHQALSMAIARLKGEWLDSVAMTRPLRVADLSGYVMHQPAEVLRVELNTVATADVAQPHSELERLALNSLEALRDIDPYYVVLPSPELPVGVVSVLRETGETEETYTIHCYLCRYQRFSGSTLGVSIRVNVVQLENEEGLPWSGRTDYVVRELELLRGKLSELASTRVGDAGIQVVSGL